MRINGVLTNQKGDLRIVNKILPAVHLLSSVFPEERIGSPGEVALNDFEGVVEAAFCHCNAASLKIPSMTESE